MKRTRRADTKKKKGARVRRAMAAKIETPIDVDALDKIEGTLDRIENARDSIVQLLERDRDASIDSWITDRNEPRTWLPDGTWRAGNIEIRTCGSLYWKGLRTDIKLSDDFGYGVTRIPWDLLNFMAEEYALDREEKYLLLYGPEAHANALRPVLNYMAEDYALDQRSSAEKTRAFDLIVGEDTKASGSGAECVICQDNEPQCANTACGHKSFCIRCANKFAEEKENLCPVCRCQIEKLIRIY